MPVVILFTGHMIDAPGRDPSKRRFPPDKETVAREAVKSALAGLLAHSDGEAAGISGGANGGDIIFHEVCEELGIPTRLYLALPLEEFIRVSVEAAGDEWVRRFRSLYERKKLAGELLGAEHLPPPPRGSGEGYSVWQLNNFWMLSDAIALAAETGAQLALIALWDGRGGDGPGGTEDLVEQARGRGARVHILPTEELFGLARREQGRS